MVLTAKTLLVRSTIAQVAASLLANWGMLNTGMAMGFPSVVVPPLVGSGPGLHTSFKEASWIASISYISALISSLLAGPMIDRVGRRWGLMLMNLTFAISWLLLSVFHLSLLATYFGRVLAGVGIGLACASVSYTAEIGTVSLRTILVNFNPTLKALGTFLIYLWACFYQDSWTEVSYLGLGLTILPILLTPLLPESPLWLQSKGRAEEALQALQKLRGASAPEQVKEELDSFSSRASDKQQTTSWLSTFHNLRQPQAYKPLMFMFSFSIVSQLSGVTVVINYAVNFTQKAGLGGEAYYVALAISSMRLASTFLTTWGCSRWGMRPPALFSSVVMVVSLLMLALSVSSLLTFPPWLVGFLVLLYVLTSTTGYSSIYWAVLGELFPTSVRGFSSTVSVLRCLRIGWHAASIPFPSGDSW
ncbi:facilitated trehalose transporter Tret1-like isoform X2 [Homalodisca vitripennis]|uniref:facilitated trehalose transporter Tret1-like isoform X2 n=1 Tax=Homalodisca vitripennis TaxID=197043 RepID=UPI001EEBDB4B|nr:facilitated trehalose transporter Tret1-like isoform X2 [Homalodisca vitripennis]